MAYEDRLMEGWALQAMLEKDVSLALEVLRSGKELSLGFRCMLAELLDPDNDTGVNYSPTSRKRRAKPMKNRAQDFRVHERIKAYVEKYGGSLDAAFRSVDLTPNQISPDAIEKAYYRVEAAIKDRPSASDILLGKIKQKRPSN